MDLDLQEDRAQGKERKTEGPRFELGLEKKGVQGRKPHEEGHRGPKHSIREKHEMKLATGHRTSTYPVVKMGAVVIRMLLLLQKRRLQLSVCLPLLV